MFDEKFWLALAFLSFVALSFKFILPKIAKILDNKSKKIAEDILEAKKLREQAQKLLEEAQTFHKLSVEKSQQIINDAMIEAKNIENLAKKNLDEQIDKIKNTALERIKNEQEFAIRQVKTTIIEEVVNQFSALQLSEEQHQKIVANALRKIS